MIGWVVREIIITKLKWKMSAVSFPSVLFVYLVKNVLEEP